MSNKSLIWIGAIVGGIVGGFVPKLWGAPAISFSSILWNGIGSMLGIWIMFKLTR